jgi:hypothetical protein
VADLALDLEAGPLGGRQLGRVLDVGVTWMRSVRVCSNR